ncbi:hypothetical protein EVAR_31476_1 [Eumeta japonica]|uniref:Uncharacterized protein n=1 Tax=Eumeta variegata TaxID=151549 RepID=A0A4C1W971_EUMVA|nr:hypothetical protein EVAR_31476_1 [Eumeta japonica]
MRTVAVPPPSALRPALYFQSTKRPIRSRSISGRRRRASGAGAASFVSAKIHKARSYHLSDVNDGDPGTGYPEIGILGHDDFHMSISFLIGHSSGCGWESLMKNVTLGNVTMSHRTRERPAECLASLSHSTMIGLPRAQH